MTDGSTPKKRRPTQADVARVARVSQTTVSQVLNNNATIAVPDETRRRILSAIDELGYVPDSTARSLRTRKTYTIASVIPDITNPFYPAVERGIQAVVDEHSYDLIVYNTDGILEKERRYLRSLQQGRVDAVFGVFFHLTARDLLPLLERNIPVVRLESRAKEAGALPLDNLFVDSVAAARTAVEYLIERGHTRIGAIVGQSGPGPVRLQGYRMALAKHGLPVDDLLITNSDFTENGGYNAMRLLLERARQLTAVFAANDLVAMGAMVALRHAGLHVPNDVAVIGYDDIPAARLVSPSLTTIALHQEQLGRRAAELLFERLGGRAPEGGRSEAMPFALVRRESA